MKLALFSSPDTSTSNPKLGIVVNDKVLDIRQNAPFLPSSIVDAIRNWEDTRTILESCIKEAPEYQLSTVELFSPIMQPNKVLAIAKNYSAHAKEMGSEVSEVQNWFCKQPTSINPPNAAVAMPVVSDKLDYEAELVVVIGKYARHVPPERAHEVIGGFMCGCDYSVRDWQKAVPNFTMGKGFDTHAPIGPFLVTPDEIEDLENLRIRCFVNDEKRQDGRVGDMIFSIADQIAHLSAAMTLEPGDIIFTGTPEGVGQGFKPPKYLKCGDQVRIEIDEIGSMAAEIVAESGECVISADKYA